MLRATSGLGALAVVFSLAACATVGVSTDYNPGTDFSSYRTFAWMPDVGTVDDVRLTGGLVQGRIQAAVETVLQEKGLQLLDDPAEADLAIGYHASLSDRVDVETMNTFNGYYGRAGWRYPGYWGTSQTYTSEYTEGTLIVDVFDTESRDMVWRGVGEGRIREAADPEDRQERLTDALRDVFADFPPN